MQSDGSPMMALGMKLAGQCTGNVAEMSRSIPGDWAVWGNTRLSYCTSAGGIDSRRMVAGDRIPWGKRKPFCGKRIHAGLPAPRERRRSNEVVGPLPQAGFVARSRVQEPKSATISFRYT